jgi:hypothetical protein
MQMFRSDVEKIVGVIGSREGVSHASVSRYELGVVVLAGVLVGAEEQHMLAEVRETG